MMRSWQKRPPRGAAFTLVEVVIALAILAIALGALLATVAQAKDEILRSWNARAEQHVLQNQMVEVGLV